MQVSDSPAGDRLRPGEDRRESGEEGERVAEEERGEGPRRGDEVNGVPFFIHPFLFYVLESFGPISYSSFPALDFDVSAGGDTL